MAQPRWEYETSVWAPPSYHERRQELHDMLDEMGDQGWELVTSFLAPTGGMVFVYKRLAKTWGLKG